MDCGEFDSDLQLEKHVRLMLQFSALFVLNLSPAQAANTALFAFFVAKTNAFLTP
jgi:hypothetical protein